MLCNRGRVMEHKGKVSCTAGFPKGENIMSMPPKEDLKEGLVILAGIIFWFLVGLAFLAPFKAVGWGK